MGLEIHHTRFGRKISRLHLVIIRGRRNECVTADSLFTKRSLDQGMSWFSSEPEAPAGPSPMDLAKQEIDMYSDLFSKMSNMCFQKCVLKMSGESDLNVGEMTCVDRCVSKYMEAQDKVGTVLKNAEESLAAQQPGAAGVGAVAPGR